MCNGKRAINNRHLKFENKLQSFLEKGAIVHLDFSATCSKVFSEQKVNFTKFLSELQ